VEVDIQADCAVCAVRDLRRRVMFRKGDLVMCVRNCTGCCHEAIGRIGEVADPDWSGHVQRGKWVEHCIHWVDPSGQDWISPRAELVRLTPPPTLIETEKEMTV
jgi:hypothetical protein